MKKHLPILLSISLLASCRHGRIGDEEELRFIRTNVYQPWVVTQSVFSTRPETLHIQRERITQVEEERLVVTTNLSPVLESVSSNWTVITNERVSTQAYFLTNLVVLPLPPLVRTNRFLVTNTPRSTLTNLSYDFYATPEGRRQITKATQWVTNLRFSNEIRIFPTNALEIRWDFLSNLVLETRALSEAERTSILTQATVFQRPVTNRYVEQIERMRTLRTEQVSTQYRLQTLTIDLEPRWRERETRRSRSEWWIRLAAALGGAIAGFFAARAILRRP